MDACGGGLARQLSNKYNELEKSYAKFCEEHHYNFINLCGKVFYYNNYKIIANIFSQKENFDTDYENMEIALEQVKNFANKYNMSVAIPYGIGCGIANGDWEKVYKIIEKVFSDYAITLYRLEEKMTRKEQKQI